jgi:hypothetical protein
MTPYLYLRAWYCILSKVIPNREGGRYGRPYSTGSQRPAESRAGFSSVTLTGLQRLSFWRREDP